MWTSKQLREAFTGYFRKRGHEIIESSSVVPLDDDTLLFTNSGMVQFKSNLLGVKNKFSGVRRACSVQRCIRAGGKHNDLDDVGKDTYHHTFFEMMGNWSFGDYFKKEAIDYAWDFLVNILKISGDRLYATYFHDEASDVDPDTETKRLWSRYLPLSHIVKGSFRNNFWEMGDTGPCGPCSEIHFDRIGGRDASGLVNTDDPDVLEVWNLVFMQYNRTDSGMDKLRVPSIDTGIGFERLLSILNNVRSNYLTDLFVPLFEYIRNEGDLDEYKDTISGPSAGVDAGYRILADHSRTIAVCLHYGVVPSNEGRGYVLRRICRRAVRCAQETLGLKAGVLERLVEKAAGILGISLEESVLRAVSREEALFGRTLNRGIVLFKKLAAKGSTISGRDAFVLYDTYGFPLDLTKILAAENNATVDEEEFHRERERSRMLSREARRRPFSLPESSITTDDRYKYLENGIDAELLFQSEREGEVGCVFDKTCFYYECGGQVGDSGVITFYEDGVKVGVLAVADTQMISGNIFHIGKLDGRTAAAARLVFDSDRRDKIKKSHTGVHILYYFLRKTLLDEVIEQKGSLVEAGRLRFDFSCSRALGTEEIRDIEAKMNSLVDEDCSVEVEVVKFEGLDPSVTRNTNEEYPEYVRNVRVLWKNDTIQDLCGGVHVKRTSEIERIRIISETGVSLNTRRIVALTGEAAARAEEDARRLLEAGSAEGALPTIPLVERREIERIRDARAKALDEKRVKTIMEQLKRANELVLQLRTEALMADGKERPFVSFEYDGSCISTKDVRKQVRKVMDIFEKNGINGIAYCFVNGGVHLVLSQECGDVLERIRGCLDSTSVRTVDRFYICYGTVGTKEAFIAAVIK
ncbi:UNVERIFIED_CONTAM: hypothetical protein PYX00_011542 [Menopon gallinae]|uniref:Alanine--tRNA ligase n=1 Tax=Menopon gallinae TaxID=328185 RepID=A0AAW2H7W7_9NEOP